MKTIPLYKYIKKTQICKILAYANVIQLLIRILLSIINYNYKNYPLPLQNIVERAFLRKMVTPPILGKPASTACVVQGIGNIAWLFIVTSAGVSLMPAPISMIIVIKIWNNIVLLYEGRYKNNTTWCCSTQGEVNLLESRSILMTRIIKYMLSDTKWLQRKLRYMRVLALVSILSIMPYPQATRKKCSIYDRVIKKGTK